jgi:hypothetical protein
MADKVYFKTGKLTPEERELILDITHGDPYTKIITDLYYFIKSETFNPREIPTQLREFYSQIATYNKNVFPIKDFDIMKSSPKHCFYYELQDRAKILKYMAQLPSVASRNMKADIRKERDMREFADYLHYLEYFMGYFSLLSNRPDDLRQKIYDKMFTANTNVDKLCDFVNDKANLLGGNVYTSEMFRELEKTNYENFEIIYDKEPIMVIEVVSPQGIKIVGSNSLWCFTYGKELNWQDWGRYSYNGRVYVIIDFKEDPESPQFMHVLIHPLAKKYTEDNEDQSPLYDMANDQVTEPHWTLQSIFGKYNYKKLLNFGY